MTERYPDDASLLAINQDPATGVEYIRTGQSPYYLAFRKLLYRLLRATERANDLRVYQDGDLTVGVRPGRASIQNAPIAFAGTTGMSLATDATHHVWLDNAGNVQTGTSGFPADRTTFVPLAEVTVGTGAIQTITDRRGEAFLATPALHALNIDADASQINQALDGISANVTASALSTLTAGGLSTADALHRHLGVYQTVAGEAAFELINDHGDAAANVAAKFSLPQSFPTDTFLLVNKANGFLQQRYDGVAYNLSGAVYPQFTYDGALGASINGRLLGAVPVAGKVTDVVLSAGGNIVSSDDADGIAATVKVNGVSVVATSPQLTDADGAGFVSTARNDGTAAAIKSDGTEQVARGDVLTVDITRTANGSVSAEPTDIAVLVVIAVDQPA